MTDPRQRLPAVNTLLDEAEKDGLLEQFPRQAVVDAIRAVLSEAREFGGTPPTSGWSIRQPSPPLPSRSATTAAGVRRATKKRIPNEFGDPTARFLAGRRAAFMRPW